MSTSLATILILSDIVALFAYLSSLQRQRGQDHNKVLHGSNERATHPVCHPGQPRTGCR